jgi:lipid-binding SYLF domain-containing protein
MKLKAIGIVCLGAGVLFGAESASSRLKTSAEVLTEIMSAPDKGIPDELLDKSQCIVIVPGMKNGAFIIGFQIGGSETDAVMLVMNRRGADKLLSSKFTVGGDASVAAGPVGRTSTANTDAKMQAEILSYSRSRGVFAGISLAGATLRPDHDANKEMYGGRKLSNKQILRGETKATAAGSELAASLNRYSTRKRIIPDRVLPHVVARPRP